MKWFNTVHYDGSIRVRIDDDDHAVIYVDLINTREIFVRAINQTYLAGAKSATMFTGDASHAGIARMNLMRAKTGTTFRGGVVTQLAEGEDGPTFRIDWDNLPFIN